MAINMPIQGTAAEIMKLAMKELYQDTIPSLSFPVQFKPWVHDSLMFQVEMGRENDLIAAVQPVMENIVTLDVPISVEAEVGTNWAEMEKVV